MSNRIQVRRGLATDWFSANTILSPGEIGYDTTNNVIKIGDGSTAWNDLESFSGSGGIDFVIEDVINRELLLYDNLTEEWKNGSLIESDIPNLSQSKITNLETDLALKANLVNGKIPVGELPIEIVFLKGTFGSSQSTTGGDLPSSNQEVGDVYIADEEYISTQANGTLFRVGDKAIWDGSSWVKNEGIAEIATKEEAEAGEVSNKLMTPERTKEAILALVQSGGANVTVSGSAPEDPASGDLWWNNNTGILYIYYEDETSGQWVDATYGSAIPTLNASEVEYSNSTSELVAENVQAAIDEIELRVSTNETDIGNKLNSSDLVSLESNLIPNIDVTYDLGSPTKKWRDLYLSGDTIFLGDTVLRSQQDGSLGVFGSDGITPNTFTIASGSIDDSLLSNDSGQIKDKVSDLELDISAVEGRLDTIEGDNETEGSIAKALQDAKDYTDIAKLGFGNNYAVATITERDLLQDLVIGDLVFVADAGSEKWAQFKVTNDDPVVFLKIMDQDVLTNAIDGPGIKAAYESNANTNAFTDDEKTLLGNLGQTNSRLDAIEENYATTKFFEAVVNANSWTLENSGTFSGAYKSIVTVTGILSTDNPIVDLDLQNVSFSNWEDYEDEWSLIKVVNSNTNQIILFASEEPSINLNFTVRVVR